MRFMPRSTPRRSASASARRLPFFSPMRHVPRPSTGMSMPLGSLVVGTRLALIGFLRGPSLPRALEEEAHLDSEGLARRQIPHAGSRHAAAAQIEAVIHIADRLDAEEILARRHIDHQLVERRRRLDAAAAIRPAENRFARPAGEAMVEI